MHVKAKKQGFGPIVIIAGTSSHVLSKVSTNQYSIKADLACVTKVTAQVSPAQ